ncbi:xylulokinase [Shewanella sp. WXL01]|uniref:xylulokinase n=1 Tax=Shewanella sp. WXL01 TaxID=2709721 RepID=UPI0014386850|nr:xylulokinase [Shewanella sp. WXL01]
MFLGIDLGTSCIKLIVMGDTGRVTATKSVALEVSRPQALWSEQSPQSWVDGLYQAMDKLAYDKALDGLQAIGLSGQMHGATLLDTQGKVLRPAILWNDGRSAEQCQQIEQLVPNARQICGNQVMPGFTAPKLLWTKQFEPAVFEQVDKVLLPKDYLRYELTGEFASDLSDATGTVWTDVAKRDWSDELLAATGLSREHMPKLYEGSEITGFLKTELAQRWGIKSVPLVAGAGDNAAGAIGVGIIKPEQAMLSLGTSGVYFAVSDGYHANPDQAVHSFCHALPNTWHLMSVVLSAASCLSWLAQLTATSVADLLLELQAHKQPLSDEVMFLPYLSGERTPHNNPYAKGMFFGMSHSTSRADLTKAVLEGVGYAFADGADKLHDSGVMPAEVSLIGGGAKSPLWRQMLADILGQNLVYRESGDVGPALGAARLAQLAVTDASIDDVCPVPTLLGEYQADQTRYERHQLRRIKFSELYQRTKDLL